MAENGTFRLKVFSPAGLVHDDVVSEVILPGSNGEVGLLPEHAQYTTLLGTGILSYQSAGEGSVVRLVISEGFASYSDGTLTILADSADRDEDIDRDHYADNRTELSKTLEEGYSEDPEWKLARVKLSRIEAIDQLISH